MTSLPLRGCRRTAEISRLIEREPAISSLSSEAVIGPPSVVAFIERDRAIPDREHQPLPRATCAASSFRFLPSDERERALASLIEEEARLSHDDE